MNRIAEDVDKNLIKVEYCDLQMGIDGLATLVQCKFDFDLLNNRLFLF